MLPGDAVRVVRLHLVLPRVAADRTRPWLNRTRRMSEPVRPALPQQLAEDLVADFQSAGLAQDAPVDFGMGFGPCSGSR